MGAGIRRSVGPLDLVWLHRWLSASAPRWPSRKPTAMGVGMRARPNGCAVDRQLRYPRLLQPGAFHRGNKYRYPRVAARKAPAALLQAWALSSYRRRIQIQATRSTAA